MCCSSVSSHSQDPFYTWLCGGYLYETIPSSRKKYHGSGKMTPLSLTIRHLELHRRSNALSAEVDEWVDRTRNEIDHNSHFSQMQALKIMMDVLVAKQKSLFETLKSTTDIPAFQQIIFDIIKEIIRTQGIWDFFRDMLELRMYPSLKEPLGTADTVAWDCYRPILNKAHELGILTPDRFREPPLIYLTAEFSPATWVRGSLPNDQNPSNPTFFLGDRRTRLPIPVIEIPWDHVVNLWEFLSLHHEVGHDLEQDLGLREALLSSLEEQLTQTGVHSPRINLWKNWEGEIIADLIGLMLAGPAFAYSLMNLLILPPNLVTTYNPNDVHPSHYVRIFINSAFVKTLIPGNDSLIKDSQNIEFLWTQLYGDIKQLGIYNVDELRSDFEFCLNGHSLREMIPFTGQDYATINAAAHFLATGQNRPAKIRPRHIISASRLAVDKIVGQPGDQSTRLDELNKRTAELARANTEPGLRAVEDSQKHRAFIASLTESLT